MANTLKIDGQLEIDIYRGVIYFHSAADGGTKLRICGLPIPLASNSNWPELVKPDGLIDITLPKMYVSTPSISVVTPSPSSGS